MVLSCTGVHVITCKLEMNFTSKRLHPSRALDLSLVSRRLGGVDFFGFFYG